jgi:hypothetical protein
MAEWIVRMAGLGGIAGLARLAWARYRRRPARPAPPDEVPQFNVVALGPQGAGKTLLLASMYNRLQTPAGRSYFLTAPYDQVVLLNKWFSQVADPATDWPYGTATGQTREFTFALTTLVGAAVHPVLRLSYLEYAGELLTEPQAPGSTTQADLVGRITAAHALIGIIDGFRIRQCLDGHAEGHWRLQQALTAMISPMMQASSPVTFVITKWDLLAGVHADENLRLGIVRNLLMANPGFRDLVATHSRQRVVRLVPVSAVGPQFAMLDAQGLVTKRPDGQIDPTNVDVPLSAVVPDVFAQAEQALDEATRAAVLAEAGRLALLRPRQVLVAVAAFVGQAAGTALLGALAGPGAAGLAGNLPARLFLESRIDPAPTPPPGGDGRLAEPERRLRQAQLARRTVLRDLQRRVDMLEGRLPASRLSASWLPGEPWS